MSKKYTCRNCNKEYSGPGCGCCHFDYYFEEHFCSYKCFDEYFAPTYEASKNSLKKLPLCDLKYIAKCFEFENSAWELEEVIDNLIKDKEAEESLKKINANKLEE